MTPYRPRSTLRSRRGNSWLVGHPGENLGDVARLDGRAAACKAARDLHQAAEIAGEHASGPALFDGAQLLLEDRTGDVGIFDREGPAEAAAHLAVGKLDELKPLDAREQPARRRGDAEFAQGGAGIVIGDGALEARIDLADAKHIDDKARQLEAFRC